MGIQGWQWLLILAVILLLFGAAKLPALAKSLGQSARVFKGEIKAMNDEDAAAKNAGTASATSDTENSQAAKKSTDVSGNSSPAP